jgi:hydroperoxide dehydratase
MAPQVTAIGAPLTIPTNVGDGFSLRAVDSWKNLGSGSSTVSAVPSKPKFRTLRSSRVSSSPSDDSDSNNRRLSTIRFVSLSDVPSSTEDDSVSDLPLKEIPGTYGLPFFGAVKDRLDFNWFQKPPLFYTARRDKYKSTVYRTNVPPGPPFFPDPRVVMLLDEKSYPILFDVSKVWKKDIFVGTYVPSVAITGGYRVLSYLDPSEPKHKLLKEFAFEILKHSGPRIIPELTVAVNDMFSSFEAGIKKDGKVNFANKIQTSTYQMILKMYTNIDPYAPGEKSLGEGASNWTKLWLLAQIAPITVFPVPWFLAPLVELFLHSLPVPPFLVQGLYNKLLNFFGDATELLDIAVKLGLDRTEAQHNLVFLTVFNAWGGINLLFPLIVQRLGSTTAEYQKELATEVRKAVDDHGGKLSPKALEAMPLVVSAVYEVLRIDPPVPYQYAKAKEDLVIESHDAAFKIKKGETLAGFMPVCCRDPKVFEDAENYLPKRFLGEGEALLKYVLWSNGPQTQETTTQNKHCAGKNFVLLVAQLFVAATYLQYDTLQVDSTSTFLTTLKPNTSV